MDDNRRVSCDRAWRLPMLALAVFVSLLCAAPASADDTSPDPPSDASAVDVYRESVPTSGGPHVVDPNRVRTIPLPAAIEERLRREGGREARILDRIATSSDLGAPDRRLPAPAGSGPRATLPEGWAPGGLRRAGLDVLALRRDQARMLVVAGALLACLVAACALRLRARALRPTD